MTIRRGGSIIAGAFGELPSQTGQSGKYLTTNGSVTSWSDIQSGSFRNIGEIVTSTIPLIDAELHLLDGALISGGGIYDDFVQYIAGLSGSYPQCFTDETTWQNTVNSKGVCGKFVYNSINNTVRLPKITGFIEGTVDSSALGDLVEAGLPNITGNFGVMIPNYHFEKCSGVFQGVTIDNNSTFSWTGGNTTGTCYGYSINASRSSSIYGNSSTVQPQSIKVFYYIVVANSTKTNIEVDIDEIVTDLNSKADDIDVVHKIGNETIAGDKTFSGTTAVVTPAVSDNSTKPATTSYIETKFQVVSALPANPDGNVYYFIPE